MSEKIQATNNFISYDYLEIQKNAEKFSLMLDAYKNFGWQTDETIENKDTITLKRNRKIANKTELTRLQRHFESCLNTLKIIEKSKTSVAKIKSIATGIIGTAFMAGSVFAITATPPIIWLCALLGFFGMAGWALPFFIYRKTVVQKTATTTILLEEQYDEIANICEKANKLL